MTAELPEGVREMAAAGALAPLARSGPSPLLTLTDEEMFVLYGNAGKERFASPWLDRLAVNRGETFDVGMLMATARRSMLARGMIAPEVVLAAAEKRVVVGDPQQMSANFLITGTLTRRNHAVVRLEAFSEAPEERGAHHVFVDRDGTVLHEQTSPDGLHHFMMQEVSESVDLLRSFVLGRNANEGDSSSMGTEDEPVLPWRGDTRAAATDPALLEHTGALVAETRILLSGRSSAVQGEIHLVSGRHALAILQPDPGHLDDEVTITARKVSVEELGEMLEYLVGHAADDATEERS
jgi:hypothetical protein